MTLAETLYGMMQQSQAAAQPVALRVGTVATASPLTITLNPQMPPLQRSQLYLTGAVVEKTLSGLRHTHTIPTGSSGPALENAACTEHGKVLPSSGGAVTLNRALAAGDKVLLLRVEQGQRYVVLSRLYA